MRIGSGFDVHAYGPGDSIVLGGVRIPHTRGVVAHSDGDVVLHALCDAMLGAAGLGDIGSLFPSDSGEWEGARSLDLLSRAYEQVRAMGYNLANADCVLVGEAPRIAPFRPAMHERLAEAMAVAPGIVTVRATTTDRLGFTGRGEGLAAIAVALLEG